VGTTNRLDTFWLKVQRWTTSCFSATPTGIPSLESCLPPVSLLIAHRQRLGALRVVCSPPSVNPATARLHTSFPSLSDYTALDSSSVSYGATGAPKPAGPRLNSPPRPGQWPGAGRFLFQPLPLPLSRPPPRSMPRTAPVNELSPPRAPFFSYIPLSNIALFIHDSVIV